MEAPPVGPNTGNFGVGGAPRIELVGGLVGRWFCNAIGTKVGAFGLNPFIACTGGLLLGEDFSGEGTGLDGF